MSKMVDFVLPSDSNPVFTPRPVCVNMGVMLRDTWNINSYIVFK
jgi:hypothetical protein